MGKGTKVLLSVLITLAVLVVGLPLALLTYLHFAWTGPDVRKASRTAEVQRLHARTAAMMDQSLETFISKAPHATKLATAVRDQCRNEVNSFGEKPQMRCNREVTVYLAFDGDPADLQRAWAKSLAAADWNWSGSAVTYQEFGYTPSGYPTARIMWSTRPDPPFDVGEFAKGIPEKDFHDQVALEQQPVDVGKVYQNAYVRHRCIADLAMTEHYYPAS